MSDRQTGQSTKKPHSCTRARRGHHSHLCRCPSRATFNSEPIGPTLSCQVLSHFFGGLFSKVDLGLNYRVINVMCQPEAELFAETAHRGVFRTDDADDAVNLLVTADLKQATQQLFAESLSLESVTDYKRELCLVSPPNLAQPTDAEDLMSAGFGIDAFGDQSQLAIVVNEANSGQTLVGDPRAQLHRVKVAKLYGPLREGCMECHHERLVFRTNGPQDE